MAVENGHGKTVVRLAGGFDLSTKKEFETQFARVTSSSPAEVVIDLRDVEFIDSTGLSLVLEAWSSARRCGFDFAILLNSRIRKVFEETGLDQALPIIERPAPPPT
jgi:anti-sigma B factor antagonist